MTEIEARVADLIKFSSNQKPIDFEDAFKAILQDKVTSAIEGKKQQMAMNMFVNPSDDYETEEEIETDEVEDQEDGEDA